MHQGKDPGKAYAAYVRIFSFRIAGYLVAGHQRDQDYFSEL
jgi:hypothetical protein